MKDLQRSAKVGAPGLVNFIAVVAYHLCPTTQPGASTLADLCIEVEVANYKVGLKIGPRVVRIFQSS